MGGVMFTRCDACLRVEGTGGGAGCVDVLEGLGAGGANAWAWCAVGWVGCWPSGVGGLLAKWGGWPSGPGLVGDGSFLDPLGPS